MLLFLSLNNKIDKINQLLLLLLLIIIINLNEMILILIIIIEKQKKLSYFFCNIHLNCLRILD